MLVVVGNEIICNFIIQGMMVFVEYFDQWELYKKVCLEIVVDEIVCWVILVIVFQCIVLWDYELFGVQIKKGQWVVMFYWLVNFDEEVFQDLFIFNILCNFNLYVGFGGIGVYYCIGVNLVWMMINLIFNVVVDYMFDFKLILVFEWLWFGWFNGIKYWQVDYIGRCLVVY